MIVAKYKFDPNTYADLLPTTQPNGWTYTKSDVTNSDGTIIRTLESNTLPTSIIFGNQGGGGATDKTKALLEVISLDLSNVSNCFLLFLSCTNLKSALGIKLTSKTTNMNSMFFSCSSLTSLDLNNWDTSNVTNMAKMFHTCSSLTSLDLNNWNTSKVTNMTDMFNNCSSLTSLDLSKWNTSKVTNMASLFLGCKALTSLNLSNWNTSQVTTMFSMFTNCSSLTSLDVSKWDVSQVTIMINIFQGCSKLTSLDLSNWNTSKVTNMMGIFQNCSSLTSLDLNNWDTSNVTNMSNMFNSCSSLVLLDIINLNTSKVTTMASLFVGCKALTSLDVSKWNVSQVTTMSYMFLGCTSLTQLDVSNWNTSKVTNMASMFNTCSSLTSLDLNNWNTSKVTNMTDMFNNCSSLTSLDLSKWNTSQVLYIVNSFFNCRNLRKINLKYADEYTVSKIHENLLNRSSTTKGYILSSVDFTSNKNWQIIKSSHNEFYLPQPLNKIGDVKDRLYWDEDKGYYCIEQMICRINISDYDWWELESSADGYDTFKLGGFNNNAIYFPTVWGGRIIVSDDSVITLDAIHLRMKYPSSRFSGDVEKFKEYCLSNGVYALLQRYGTDKAITIDLPHLNQKLTFDSYNPSTTIDIPNRPLKASKTYLDAPIARYKYTNLQPNTQYNVQFDCKGDSGIKVNLGGTEVTFTPTSEWTRKNLTITTPSELVNDKLSISNVGITSNNKVDNVMLFSEVIAQEPDYIEGIQNIGELQEDGTYKIDVLSNSSYNLYNEFDYTVVGSDRVSNTFISVSINDTFAISCNDDNFWLGIMTYDSDKNLLSKALDVKGRGILKISSSNIEYIKPFCQNSDTSTKKIQLTKSSEFLKYIPYGNGVYEKSIQSILLPQPLNKIGEIKDKFYWDYDKGHYCIEQNITHRMLSPLSSDFHRIELSDDSSYIKAMLNIDTFAPNHNISDNLVFIPPLSNTLTGSNYSDYGDVNGNVIALHTNILLKFETKYLVSNDAEGLAQWFVDNPTYIEYVCYPQIIDLTEMNQKFTFDTYLPNTYLDVTNLPLQPYGLLLEDDTVRYKSTIEPSTLYTIQFNCIAKSTTLLTLDLGGSRLTVDPIIGVNHVQITTPSELASDRLFLIGTGIIINEVIVNKGNMRQYTKYFDGEQSVGELQDDGSYIIRISTDNYTGLWEGDL